MSTFRLLCAVFHDLLYLLVQGLHLPLAYLEVAQLHTLQNLTAVELESLTLLSFIDNSLGSDTQGLPALGVAPYFNKSLSA